MISIKRHLDAWKQKDGTTAANPELAPYLSLLASVMQCGARAVPGIGLDPDQKLSGIASALKNEPGDPAHTACLQAVNHEVREHLTAWADRALQRHQHNEHEIGQIVVAMRNAVDTLTARDAVYKKEVGDLTARLHSITSMDDLALIREAIVDSANSLTACVERTAEAGQRSLEHLKADVERYRARLSDTEKLSALDSLTGLANRRTFEERLAFRVRSGSRFSLILIDLNGFKEVNDHLGHIAGDEVLKSVAAKLRIEFPSADLLARWGGDEFAVIVTCSETDAEARVGRIRRKPIGECRVVRNGRTLTADIHAAFGVVEWNGAESGTTLLNRVDSCMYRQKRSPELPAAE